MSASGTRGTVLVVEHEKDAPVGWLGERWTEQGIDLDVVVAHDGHPLPSRCEHDALVVLGGAMGACDDADHAWLAATRALIADTVRGGRPFLGICLGHQLAAAALGGRVAPNPHGRTRGVRRVALTEAGREDELLGGFGERPALHYNNDVVVELPTAATMLAATPDGAPQAVRYGPLAWGVQFHPEASPGILARWGASEGDDGAGWRSEVDAVSAELRATWRDFADRFATLAGCC